jgi:chromosome transmission fidelity protein 8
MSQILLHTSASVLPKPSSNPLPTLFHTPSGLALLELQGMINLPENDNEDATAVQGAMRETPVGRLVFPDYVEGGGDGWMKRVYMFVGKHQRLTGEVKKLPKAVAIIRKRVDGEGDMGGDGQEELEIVDIVKYKIIFSTRPEPVGALPEGT